MSTDERGGGATMVELERKIYAGGSAGLWSFRPGDSYLFIGY